MLIVPFNQIRLERKNGCLIWKFASNLSGSWGSRHVVFLQIFASNFKLLLPGDWSCALICFPCLKQVRREWNLRLPGAWMRFRIVIAIVRSAWNMWFRKKQLYLSDWHRECFSLEEINLKIDKINRSFFFTFLVKLTLQRSACRFFRQNYDCFLMILGHTWEQKSILFHVLFIIMWPQIAL